MGKPSQRVRKKLEKQTARYQEHLMAASGYLAGRGIPLEAAKASRLGVVILPDPEHEPFTGRLSIPYIDKLGVYGLKFRCLAGHDCKAENCPKYLYPTGQETGLYGITDVDDPGSTIHVTEGELDRLVLRWTLDEPVVGVPGSENWKPHHWHHFAGFERVLLWTDGDEAGKKLAGKIMDQVRQAERIILPSGHDVNSLYLASGAQALLDLAGGRDQED